MTTQVEQREDEQGRKHVQVRVTYLNTNEEVRFRVGLEETLAAVWDRAYAELGEARRDGDQLQCADGTSLMDALDRTMAQLHQQHLCPGRRFEIRSETGGA
jgi:hypothetical protein